MQKQKVVYKTYLQRNIAAVLAEMSGIGTRAKENCGLETAQIQNCKQATSHQTCKTCKTHDYRKKTPRLGSQSILPSASFALAQQASIREQSKAFTKDDDDKTSLFLCFPQLSGKRLDTPTYFVHTSCRLNTLNDETATLHSD